MCFYVCVHFNEDSSVELKARDMKKPFKYAFSLDIPNLINLHFISYSMLLWMNSVTYSLWEYLKCLSKEKYTWLANVTLSVSVCVQ